MGSGCRAKRFCDVCGFRDNQKRVSSSYLVERLKVTIEGIPGNFLEIGEEKGDFHLKNSDLQSDFK